MKRAADMGERTSALDLGLMYMQGHGTEEVPWRAEAQHAGAQHEGQHARGAQICMRRGCSMQL